MARDYYQQQQPRRPGNDHGGGSFSVDQMVVGQMVTQLQSLSNSLSHMATKDDLRQAVQGLMPRELYDAKHEALVQRVNSHDKLLDDLRSTVYQERLADAEQRSQEEVALTRGLGAVRSDNQSNVASTREKNLQDQVQVMRLYFTITIGLVLAMAGGVVGYLVHH